jgi:signal transduction histidine kinase
MRLYVVKQIVEAHNGRIEVHSDLGHGATFQIRFPLALVARASCP